MMMLLLVWYAIGVEITFWDFKFNDLSVGLLSELYCIPRYIASIMVLLIPLTWPITICEWIADLWPR